MVDETNRDRLEKEAFNYIRLGTILKRSRSLAKKEAVGKVVASDLTVEDKIKEIENIDGVAEPTRGRPRGVAQPPKAPAPTEETFYKNPDRVKRSVINSLRNRQKILADPPVSGWLNYVFTERPGFLEFARSTHLINPGLLGLFPKIDRIRVAKLAGGLQKDLVPKTKATVSTILESGWRHLTKYEYNLVAAYLKLLDEISRANFRWETKDDRTLISHFFTLEHAFLLFHARPDFIKDLVAALDTALSVDISRETERKTTTAQTKLLLRPDLARPNLVDFLLALSMLHSRRALRIADLLSADHSTLISTEEFNCTGAVQKDIDEQIAGLVKKLAPLTTERDRSRAAMRFIPCDENEDLDLGTIVVLAGGKSAVLDKRADAGKLAVLISHHFVETFGALLEKETGAFSSEYELGKLNLATTTLEKHGTPVPYARFRATKLGAVNPTQFEAEAVAKITEIATIFRTIGMKISDNIDQHLKAKAEAQEKPLATPTLEAGSMDELLADQEPMNQRAETAAKTAFAIAGYFMNSEVLADIQGERTVKDEIRVTMRMLERLALAEEYTAIRDHFGLLGY